jgi:enoyl-CoA hydratase/carnithine racemase
VEFQRLRLERDGDVLHVHLNRPECRNALDASALEEIERLFGSLQRDFGVRVVVLGGSGPSFCGGADRRDPPGARRLAADSGATDRERRFVAQLGLRACRAIEVAEPVTLARLHGHVVGGGVALAAACDFRIASRDTSFHVPEVDLGIPLAWGATPRLIAEIGAARARELILLCERVGAEQAERWGLVHRVVEAEQLDSVVSDWARRLSAKPEVAVHMTKTQLRAYAARASLGNVAEADGDLLLGASRLGRARQSFPRPPQGSGPDGA